MTEEPSTNLHEPSANRRLAFGYSWSYSRMVVPTARGRLERPAEGVSAKVLRSESRVRARVTVNNGADETCQVFARSQCNLSPNPRPVIQPLAPAFALVAGRVRAPPAMIDQKLLGKFLLFLLLQLLSLCLRLSRLSRHSALLSRRPNDLLKVLRILSRVGLKYPHQNYTNN